MSDVVSLRVIDGHVTLDQPFVYCWLHPQNQSVLFVGATWLHPAARAELHLQGRDPEARIVGENLERLGLDLNQEMRVLAFPILHEWDRQTARHSLIAALSHSNLLSSVYFGPAPQTIEAQEIDQEWIERAVKTIKANQSKAP